MSDTHFYYFAHSRFYRYEVDFSKPINENRALVDHILVEQTQKVPNISDAETGFRSIIGTCE